MFEVGQWIEDQYLLIERVRTRQWIHYIAQDRISENVFVIRRPSDTLCPDGFSAEEFRKGANAWITLAESDKIIKAYLLKDLEGVPHLFLQYVDGPSLEEVLAANRGKPLLMSRTIQLMKQLAEAMNHLHKRSLADGHIGLPHGCLTPQSILIQDGNVKITDIGMANVFHTVGGGINAAFPLNSVPYVAPERIREPAIIDRLTDIYSFGAIMYEAATGILPFMTHYTDDPLSVAVGANPPPPRIRNRWCPRWVEETIMKCIAADPEKRFQSFEQIETLISKLAESPLTEKESAGEESGKSARSRVARIRGVAKKESSSLNQYYLGVEHIMLGLISEEESIVVSFLGDSVPADQMRAEILSRLPKGTGPWQWEGVRKTPRYRRVMHIARQTVREYNCERMLPHHILLAILREGQSIPVHVLTKLGVDTKTAIRRLEQEIMRRCSGILITEEERPSDRFVRVAPYESDSPFIPPFIDRDAEMERAVALLLEERRNILVVGMCGVGKTAFVNQLGNVIRQAMTGTASRGLLKLHLPSLLSSAGGDTNRALDEFDKTFDSVADEGAMLLVEDLPLLFEIKGEKSSRTPAAMLEDRMISKDLPVVATATPGGYANCEVKSLRMTTLFEVINLAEPSPDVAVAMLNASRKTFEREYSVQILDEAFEAASSLSEKFNADRELPARAFELLARACADARLDARMPATAGTSITIDAALVERVLTRESP